MGAEPLGGLMRLEAAVTRGAAAAQRLREAIISGALPPGALLKDMEVAARMGLSPVPLREAMVQLAAEGLVEISPNRWKRVAALDYDAMVELVEVQQKIWRIGYEWGAPRLSPADIDQLTMVNAAQVEAIAAGNAGDAINAAMSFHLVFMRASGNRELCRISVDRLPLIRRFVLLAAPKMALEHGLEFHCAILDAAVRGDVEACLDHYGKTGALLLETARAAREGHLERQATAATDPQ